MLLWNQNIIPVKIVCCERFSGPGKRNLKLDSALMNNLGEKQNDHIVLIKFLFCIQNIYDKSVAFFCCAFNFLLPDMAGSAAGTVHTHPVFSGCKLSCPNTTMKFSVKDLCVFSDTDSAVILSSFLFKGCAPFKPGI